MHSRSSSRGLGGVDTRSRRSDGRGGMIDGGQIQRPVAPGVDSSGFDRPNKHTPISPPGRNVPDRRDTQLESVIALQHALDGQLAPVPKPQPEAPDLLFMMATPLPLAHTTRSPAFGHQIGHPLAFDDIELAEPLDGFRRCGFVGHPSAAGLDRQTFNPHQKLQTIDQQPAGGEISDFAAMVSRRGRDFGFGASASHWPAVTVPELKGRAYP